MENASRALLDAVRKSMRQIRSVIGATVINPDLLTAAERLQYEGYLHREDANTVVLTLWKDGVPIKQIVKRTGQAREATSSDLAKARWRLSFPGSTPNGMPVSETLHHCGAP